MLVRYRNHLILAGYRPRTVTDRIRVLTAFANELPHPLTEATRENIEAFLARPLAPESRRCYRSHLRAFYHWCVDEGLLAEDPTEKVPSIRITRGTPRPISESDLALALERADRRMRAWLLLMALAGLRACEVSILQPRDLIPTDHGVLLYLRETKGGGTATVPAHPEVITALSVLPIRQNGTWWTCEPHSVSTQVSRHLRDQGIRASGHQLRHFAATAWYQHSGHDLLVTAQLMRHAQVNTTMVYAALSPTRPAQVVRLVELPRQHVPA